MTSRLISSLRQLTARVGCLAATAEAALGLNELVHELSSAVLNYHPDDREAPRLRA